ncbi:hypothetical protein PR048_000476 [Dryococelus australis]|uniref:Uncharacterized protein n=1 Tax=Dryococelus australis TaxID=614101 RepID=A0ABQ9IER8_9NEOP|nr:hypothetical protein PR048_000476 [Dryococelus australis]
MLSSSPSSSITARNGRRGTYDCRADTTSSARAKASCIVSGATNHTACHTSVSTIASTKKPTAMTSRTSSEHPPKDRYDSLTISSHSSCSGSPGRWMRLRNWAWWPQLPNRSSKADTRVEYSRRCRSGSDCSMLNAGPLTTPDWGVPTLQNGCASSAIAPLSATSTFFSLPALVSVVTNLGISSAPACRPSCCCNKLLPLLLEGAHFKFHFLLNTVHPIIHTSHLSSVHVPRRAEAPASHQNIIASSLNVSETQAVVRRPVKPASLGTVCIHGIPRRRTASHERIVPGRGEGEVGLRLQGSGASESSPVPARDSNTYTIGVLVGAKASDFNLCECLVLFPVMYVMREKYLSLWCGGVTTLTHKLVCVDVGDNYRIYCVFDGKAIGGEKKGKLGFSLLRPFRVGELLIILVLSSSVVKGIGERREAPSAMLDSVIMLCHSGQSIGILYPGTWAALNIEVFRAGEGEASAAGMKGRGKREIPEKTHGPAASSGMIPPCNNPSATHAGNRTRRHRSGETCVHRSSLYPQFQPPVIDRRKEPRVFYRSLENTALFSVYAARKPGRATVTERLARSPPSKVNRVQYSAGSPDFRSGNHAAGRCRWSAGFLGDLPFPPPLHSGAAPFSPQSLSSALKTSLPSPDPEFSHPCQLAQIAPRFPSFYASLPTANVERGRKKWVSGVSRVNEGETR